MKVRNMLVALGMAPALVVLTGGQGNAAATGVVSFAGTVTVTPNASGAPQPLDVCFFATGACGNGAPSTGAAFGADTQGVVVDGLRASATYVEACTAGTGIAPTGTATITANLHYALPQTWSGDVTTTWLRAGTVAVLSGEATGVALFVPLDVPACGMPGRVLVVGAVETG